MIRVINQKRIFIVENGLGFLEGNAMLLCVCFVLSLIPLKHKTLHNYIVLLL